MSTLILAVVSHELGVCQWWMCLCRNTFRYILHNVTCECHLPSVHHTYCNSLITVPWFCRQNASSGCFVPRLSAHLAVDLASEWTGCVRVIGEWNKEWNDGGGNCSCYVRKRLRRTLTTSSVPRILTLESWAINVSKNEGRCPVQVRAMAVKRCRLVC